ncbi:ABC transporter substrate-binding protein [Mesorhizobium caraganae]|jgi:putative ABC transport system substrate-binding protein|uniref:ABC transporter substrate-binding protein n=1 Tax=Mesorhizobium caraganae TaxID=483206 RepID=UPI0017848DD2|nr:ABC transporter substrate-binding protein [Mesorhizobium caraganae]MBM2710113.1 ABC transporter substrate-binding protein [Mesorhizobium caraganae]
MALAILGCASALAADKVTVAVTAIVEHPSLDAARAGVKKALEDAGYKEGDNLTFEFESAQGQPATAAQIAQKFAGEKPNVIVAIATPSAQAVVSATQDIPVVFTAVTDPVSAQIVTDRDHPGGNVTGISDFSPLEQQLDLIREFLPSAAKIGVPFNPAESNSIALLAALKDLGKAKGFEIVEAPASKSADVAGAAQNLVGKVDVIYLPTDNTIISALETILAVGAENKLPVFSAENDTVKRGAIASVGFDYYQVGLETGAIVVRVLKGEKPGDIAVRNATGTDLMVNAKAAEAMGVTIPKSVRDRAKQVIE